MVIKMINVTVEKSVSSKDWEKRALKLIKAEAEKLGTTFEACEAFVKLPEAGRCFTKRAGDRGLTAHG